MHRTAIGLFALALAPMAWLGTAGAQPKANDQWATVKGQIVFGGAPPKREKVNVTQDKDHCESKGPLLEEKWIVDPKTKGVQNVFVWLGPDSVRPNAKFQPDQIHPALAKPKVKQVVMDQPCCQFVPHALAAQEGQDLLVKNSAPVPHNVNWASTGNGNGNVSLPPGGSHTLPDLKQDRVILIKCNVHPWMSAYVKVFDHPYFAVTDEQGNFEIKMAPTGKLRLFVWHEEIGYKGGQAGRRGEVIEVKPGVTDLGKITIKP